MVRFGLVWDNIHPKLLWKFHQNPTCFDWFREDLELVKIDKFWFGLVWYGLVWFETTSIKSYYESFIKIQLVLAVLEKIYSWFSLVRFGLVWLGMVWFETTSIWSYGLWKFHQNLTCFDWFREDLKLGVVWCDLATI